MKFKPIFDEVLITICFAACLCAGPGCKKSVPEEASESDANGFLCRSCAHKFYTGIRSFPDHCPKCHKTEVAEVVGFTCPHDQHVTIVARGPEAVRCEKCKQPTRKLKLPRKKELIAWGASADKP